MCDVQDEGRVAPFGFGKTAMDFHDRAAVLQAHEDGEASALDRADRHREAADRITGRTPLLGLDAAVGSAIGTVQCLRPVQRREKQRRWTLPEGTWRVLPALAESQVPRGGSRLAKRRDCSRRRIAQGVHRQSGGIQAMTPTRFFAAVAVAAILPLSGCGPYEPEIAAPRELREVVRIYSVGTVVRIEFTDGVRCAVFDGYKAGGLDCDWGARP